MYPTGLLRSCQKLKCKYDKIIIVENKFNQKGVSRGILCIADLLLLFIFVLFHWGLTDISLLVFILI